MVCSSQETTDDHPHLDKVIAALGRVQNNGTSLVTYCKCIKLWQNILTISFLLVWIWSNICTLLPNPNSSSSHPCLLYALRQQHSDTKLSTQWHYPICRGPPQLLPLCGLHDDSRMWTGSCLDGFSKDPVHQQSTGEQISLIVWCIPAPYFKGFELLTGEKETNFSSRNKKIYILLCED